MSNKQDKKTRDMIKQSEARVTIITPTYNRADKIEHAIKSVLAQGYKDYLYIILDDGSTDNTKAVVTNLIKGKKNCYYLYHANIGEAETVNVGWGLCESEYFLQVNSDDTIEPNLLSEMVKTLDEKPECVVAYPDFYIINDSGDVIQETKNEDWNFIDALSAFSCYAAAPGAFFRKSSIKYKNILKDSRFKHTNDIHMLWNIALKGDFTHVPKFLASWRSHDEGISSTRYEAIDEIDVWINEYFKQELPKAVRQIEPKCRQSVYNYFAQLMEISGLDYGKEMANYYREKANLPMSKYVNLQIGDNDLIGNKFNGHDLHIGLRSRGIESSHLVWNKESNDKNTYVIAGEKVDRYAIKTYNEYIQRLYDLDNVHNPLIYDIIYNKLFLEADVVHMHLMHNGLWDLNLLPLMSRLKPIVWTVHDMWIATGDARAKERPDYYFPLLSNAQNLDLNWELKKEAIKNSEVTFVVASKYMEKAMNEYPIFKEKKIVHIPFGLDFKVFHPRDNIATRKELGFGTSEKLILFRGNGGTRKGLNYIEYVINTLGKKYKLHFLVVGKDELVVPPNIKTTQYDWIKDDELMAKLYSVADLFLMPSTREYFGMMAIESMACGTLPVVLDGTSLSETVNSPSCGVSIRQDMKEYSDAVEYYLNNTEERAKREKKCVDYVKRKHSMEKYLKSLEGLYCSVISNHVKHNNYKQILNSLKVMNEIKPRLEAVSENVDISDLGKYQEKNLFFEATVGPLKSELARLKADNDMLKKDISVIYESKRWKLATKVADIKSKIIKR